MNQHNSPAILRQAVRSGEFSGNTSGCTPGFVQCNLTILPADWANDFLRFCLANPRPCPLIASSNQPGDTGLPLLGDIDIRTDVPSYRIFRDGELAGEVADIRSHWRDDLVVFALGCSFSFEEALLADGLEVRNVSEGVNVPMYRTNIDCSPAGPFQGKMVVSMRPFRAADAIRAVQICTRFPSVHGAPIHLGDPGLIGIGNLDLPDYGDAVTIKESEMPVFWACGVTPQVALEKARPPFAITHSPGHMLVTDLRNSQLAVL
ncbi:putative hydro-lyase [Seongchinamella sediminis]|uniref:Putative hydro-lyase DWB85_11470 n=1 Tax=Seongchinamella sediminis TaxID=2283635 RepID=A0A3L7DYA4_9GAMM|nr:putative hydro-lyase [Seongchinamella sediminis]RLQ21629.1 putative hydro-lyase [Seongchinamella sediminis]